jgi:hypothetical protein
VQEVRLGDAVAAERVEKLADRAGLAADAVERERVMLCRRTRGHVNLE